MGKWVVIVMLVGVLGFVGYRTLRTTPFPNLPVSTSAGESLTVAELRGDRQKLVLVLVIPGDPMSTAAAGRLDKEQEAYADRATFAALLLSDEKAVAKFAQDNELALPVYAFVPQANPIEYNQMVTAVGGWRKRFYGGTVVVLNATQGIVRQVNGNELETLSAELTHL